MQRSNRGRGSSGAERGKLADRQVNTLLGTLRNEQLRHTLNVRSKQEGVVRKPIPSIYAFNKPTLPPQLFGESFGSDGDDDEAPVQPAPFRHPGRPALRAPRPPVTLVEGVQTYAYPDGAVPGPRPPKSWSSLFSGKESETEWRASALSLFLSYLPSPPAYLLGESSGGHVQPLTLSCMRVLLSVYRDADALAELAQYIQPQLRRDLMRWCAVYEPLDTARLGALCLEDGHTDGELIVVSPQATLKADFFLKERAHRASHTESSAEEDEDWDAPSSFDTPVSLTALAVISASVSNSVLLSLPRTLTHLALLRLPQPAPVHHLTRTCPFLEVLDFSFNPWLKAEDSANTSRSSSLELSSLDRIEWHRWRNLKVLGLRECGIGRDIVKRVNETRWVDVLVIGVDSDPYSTPSGPQGNSSQ